MSTEPEKPGEEPIWSMPKPVFRSSEGRDLRAALAAAEVDTLTPDERENIMENEPKDVAEATTDPQAENAVEKHVRGDKLSFSMTAVGLLSLLVVAILFLLFYFLVFRTGGTGMP
jgi:carbohydrate-binding DOMON domain-containing protein